MPALCRTLPAQQRAGDAPAQGEGEERGEDDEERVAARCAQDRSAHRHLGNETAQPIAATPREDKDESDDKSGQQERQERLVAVEGDEPIEEA